MYRNNFRFALNTRWLAFILKPKWLIMYPGNFDFALNTRWLTLQLTIAPFTPADWHFSLSPKMHNVPWEFQCRPLHPLTDTPAFNFALNTRWKEKGNGKRKTGNSWLVKWKGKVNWWNCELVNSWVCEMVNLRLVELVNLCNGEFLICVFRILNWWICEMDCQGKQQQEKKKGKGLSFSPMTDTLA